MYCLLFCLEIISNVTISHSDLIEIDDDMEEVNANPDSTILFETSSWVAKYESLSI